MFIKSQQDLCRPHTIIDGATLIFSRDRWKLSNKDNNMNWIKRLWARIILEIRYRKKLKELRKRDPFIYK